MSVDLGRLSIITFAFLIALLSLGARDRSIAGHPASEVHRLRSVGDAQRICASSGLLLWFVPAAGVAAICVVLLGVSASLSMAHRYCIWLRRENSDRARRTRLLSAAFACLPDVSTWRKKIARTALLAELEDRASENRLRAGLGFDLAREACVGALVGCVAIHTIGAWPRVDLSAAVTVLWFGYAAADALRSLCGHLLVIEVVRERDVRAHS
jgi:hypothetical protein